MKSVRSPPSSDFSTKSSYRNRNDNILFLFFPMGVLMAKNVKYPSVQSEKIAFVEIEWQLSAQVPFIMSFFFFPFHRNGFSSYWNCCQKTTIWFKHHIELTPEVMHWMREMRVRFILLHFSVLWFWHTRTIEADAPNIWHSICNGICYKIYDFHNINVHIYIIR